MTRRMIAPLLFGLIGAAILIGLGVWQLQRLAWKQGMLAEIDARISAPPVALPVAPDPLADRFLPVIAAGGFTGEDLEVLASRKQTGPGYRVIAVLQTGDGRRVLVDRGFVAEADHRGPRVVRDVQIHGNLHWPAEVDSFTPPPDIDRNLWFARDVTAMAAALHTEAILIVARVPTGDAIEPMPVDSGAIPNDHLNYAITWFLLALAWLGMTVLLLWRMRRQGH
ncbi:MAG: SURF1 family protein [Paracoccaceae bacterium]|nr:SURF1 family protein [Paracoccaceae bacterium]